MSPGVQISNRIATEILQWDDVNMRVAVIEKWVAVADICRCLHNYNAILEITSSLNRSSIFRLKKTWLKVSKQVPASVEPSHGGGGGVHIFIRSDFLWDLVTEFIMHLLVSTWLL